MDRCGRFAAGASQARQAPRHDVCAMGSVEASRKLAETTRAARRGAQAPQPFEVAQTPRRAGRTQSACLQRIPPVGSRSGKKSRSGLHHCGMESRR